jgi:ribosome-associated translation inhibitor RaiA
MDIPLELSFHNLESSDALKKAVREHVNKLEQFHDHIIGCRVVIEMPHKSQKASGNPPDVHIVVRVPNKEIVVSREYNHGGHKKASTDAYAVLDECFLVAQKQLKDYRRVSHGDVKYKTGEPRGAGGPTILDA